jgi:hypothetical protein
LTPSASASASKPRLESEVKPLFESRVSKSGNPFLWDSATQFYVHWNQQGWQRNGEPIDWQREAMRSKAVPVPSSPVPSSPVPSASVPSEATTSTAATLPTAPLPSAPAKSAAEFLAELERATR